MTFRTPAASSSTISLEAVGPDHMSTSVAPTLQWTDRNSSTFYYEVQLSRDGLFNTNPTTGTRSVYWNLVHGGESFPLDSWTVPANAPLAGGTYYWRVRPRVQATTNGVAETGAGWTPAASFTKP